MCRVISFDLHSLMLRPMDHGVTTLSAASVVMVPPRPPARTNGGPMHICRVFCGCARLSMPRCTGDGWWPPAASRPWGGSPHLLCELFVRLQTVKLVEGYRFWCP